MKNILCIAGFDTSAGAGLQADIKTICSLKAHSLSIVTSITAQNSFGIVEKFDTTSKSLISQFDAVKKDIKIDTIKIGMIPDKRTARIISKYIEDLNVITILDTPMISSSGYRLMNKKTIKYFKKNLIPKCTLITPNIPEAKILSNIKIRNLNDMKKAAKKISKNNKIEAVLVKGGHLDNNKSIDILYYKKKYTIFKGKRLNKHNSYHGTGCTLSSAIATFLAKGYSLKKSIKKSKKYIMKSIKGAYRVGKSKTRYLQHKGYK